MKMMTVAGKVVSGLAMALALVWQTGLSGPDTALAESLPEGAANTKVRYSDMFYLAPTGYLVLDSQARVTESNVTAAAMLGVDWPTLLTSDLARFVSPESRERFQEHFQAVKRDICKQVVEVNLARPDGSVVKMRLESICAFAKDGSLAGFRVAMVNLSPIPGLAKAGQLKIG